MCGWRFIWTVCGIICALFQALGWHFNFFQSCFIAPSIGIAFLRLVFPFPILFWHFWLWRLVFLVGFHFGDFWLTFVNCGFSVEVWVLWIVGQCWGVYNKFVLWIMLCLCNICLLNVYFFKVITLNEMMVNCWNQFGGFIDVKFRIYMRVHCLSLLWKTFVEQESDWSISSLLWTDN